MSELWSPFLAALFGAIIGSFTSVFIVVVQTRSERRRDRVRLAVQAAIEDHKRVFEMAEKTGRDKIVQPLSSYIHYHARILDLLEKGHLTVDALRELNKQQHKLTKLAEDDFRDLNPRDDLSDS